MCEISILKYCLVVELFEKWRIWPPAPPGWHLILATHLAFWLLDLATPHVGGARFGRHSGGRWLGLPSPGLSPKHKEYSFLPHSPYLHEFLLMLLMLYSPLDTALLLVLLQPSGDGYFWPCSSKSSFRGTETKRVKIRSSLYNNRVAKKDFKKVGSK